MELDTHTQRETHKKLFRNSLISVFLNDFEGEFRSRIELKMFFVTSQNVAVVNYFYYFMSCVLKTLIGLQK